MKINYDCYGCQKLLGTGLLPNVHYQQIFKQKPGHGHGIRVHFSKQLPLSIRKQYNGRGYDADSHSYSFDFMCKQCSVREEQTREKSFVEHKQSIAKLHQKIAEQNFKINQLVQNLESKDSIILKSNQNNSQLEKNINLKNQVISQLQLFKNQTQNFQNQKKKIEEELQKKLQEFQVSDSAIKILLQQNLTTTKDLSEITKEDLKELGLKLKDVLAVQRMFK